MDPVMLTIYMEPVAKGRPRTTWFNGKARTYTPVSTQNAESDIKCQIINGLDLARQSFDQGVPLKLEATFYRARPKSLPKRVILPVSKPDTDNLLKTLKDAMEGLVYPNDSQITSVDAKKRFGYPPRIEVRITEDME